MLPDPAWGTMAVVMYTTSWCGFCNRAKALLARKGASVQEINIEQTEGARDKMVRLTGRMTVPQIFIGQRHVGGWDDLSALEARGELDPLLEQMA